MPNLILIGGPMGVGKSTAARKLRLGRYNALDTIKIDTSLLDADGVAAAIEKLL